MIKFWKRHSLSIVVGSIFIAMLIASWPLGKYLLMQNPPYWKYWLAQTIVSIEADVGGFFVLVLFTKWFKEIGSPASKDTSEELAKKVVDEMEDQNIKVCK